MTSEAIVLWTETSSDPELIAGVRAGDSAAFGVLYERHQAAARKVAAQYTNSASDIDDVVSESFSRLLRALQRGDGPDLAFRAYLFTIVRRTGLDIINKGIRTKPRDDMSPYESTIGYEASSDEPALDSFEHGMVADAFKSLPERWQAVLWYTEVEKKNPKEIAPLLGLSANGVAALAYRAREALRQAYLQQHLNSSQSAECLEANAQLGAYVRGGLSKRENAKVHGHVQVCDRCTGLVAELADVNRGMRGIIAPLFMGVLGVGALDGGLPVGGVLGPHGAGAGGAGAGTSGGAGAGGATGLGSSGAAGVAGAAGAAGAAGKGGGVASGITGLFGAVSHVALPAAAVVGVTALAIGGASMLGWFSPEAQDHLADGADESDVEIAEDADATLPEPAPGDTTDDTDDALAGDDDFVDDDESHVGQDDTSGGDGDGSQSGATDTPSGRSGDPAGSGDSADAGGADTTPGTVPARHNPGSTPRENSPGVEDGPGGVTEPGEPGGTDQPGTDDGTGGEGNNDVPPGSDDRDDEGENADPGDEPDVPGDPQPGPSPAPPPPPPLTLTAEFSITKSALDYLEISRDDPHISMTVENTGDAAANNVAAQVTVPSGLEIAAPHTDGSGMALITAESIFAHLNFALNGTFDAGEWQCNTNANATVATCTLDELKAGDSSTLTLPVDIVSDELADDAETAFVVRAGTVTESYTVQTALADTDGEGNPLDPGYVNTGGEAVAHFGGTVMGCDADPQPWSACYTAMVNISPGSGQNLSNNDWNMVELKPNPDSANQGTTHISLPEDAAVQAAYLEWSANRFVDPNEPHNGQVTDGWTSDLETVQVKLDSGEFVTVTAGEVDDDTVEENRQYYLARADVTDMLAEITSTTMTVADVAVASSRLEQAVRTYYGGFTLTVVYADPDVHEDTHVALFEGPHWVKGSAPVSINFRANAGDRVTPSWTAFEGDRANSGDSVSLDGHRFTPLAVRADGSVEHRDSNDAADSWANGSPWTNTLGIDANSFDSKLLASGGRHTLRASTDGDNYMIGTLAVTISPPATDG